MISFLIGVLTGGAFSAIFIMSLTRRGYFTFDITDKFRREFKDDLKEQPAPVIPYKKELTEYQIDFLDALHRKYPDHKFSIRRGNRIFVGDRMAMGLIASEKGHRFSASEDVEMMSEILEGRYV